MKRPAILCSVLICVLAARLGAQQPSQTTGTVTIEPSRSASAIDAVAGTKVRLYLTARTATGALISDWDITGTPTIIRVVNSGANTDTLEHSWNGDTLAYSFATFEPPVERIGLNDWRVPLSMFKSGVAMLQFVDTRVERDVAVHIIPTADSAIDISAAMHFRAGPLSNYELEITSQTASPDQVYLLRPYELVVTPRDRYLNIVTDTVTTRFSARFPFEFVRNTPGLFDIQASRTVLRGATPFRIASVLSRVTATDELQYIIATSLRKPAITGKSTPYEILHHAPLPFPLTSPADRALFGAMGATDSLVFRWRETVPRDPFTDIRISRFSPETFSDSVRYRIQFIDSATLGRSCSLPSDGNGTLPRFTLRRETMRGIVETLAFDSTETACNAIWRVEASDGMYSTFSRPDDSTAIGHRITFPKRAWTACRLEISVAHTGPALDTTAGAVVPITITVRDTLGNPYLNWHTLDLPMRLTVSSAANTDSSRRSWSDDPDAYTFTRIRVRATGEILPTDVRGGWTLESDRFTDGRLVLDFIDTKAEKGVTLTVGGPGLAVTTTPMRFRPGATTGLLVDVTWRANRKQSVFLRRPFEVVVIPRDLYSNPTGETVEAQFSAAFPAEFSFTEPGCKDLFSGTQTLDGAMGVLFCPTVARSLPGALQQIFVRNARAPNIQGQSDPIEVIHHAPNSPAALEPKDHNKLVILFYDDVPVPFRWRPAIPPDPFWRVWVSRFTQVESSDTIRYALVFADSAGGRWRARYPLQDSTTVLNMITNAKLLDMMRAMGGSPVASAAHFLWYIEATDGIDTLAVSDAKGNHLFVWFNPHDGIEPTSGTVNHASLGQNYPNPIFAASDALAATTITFSLDASDHVALTLYNALGMRVATLFEGDASPGEHTVPVSLRLTPGVYVYALRSSSGILTRRMVVLGE
jgi:hypothetical protein